MAAPSRKVKVTFFIFMLLLAGMFVGAVAVIILITLPAQRGPTQPQSTSTTIVPDMRVVPELSREVVADNLDHPWEVAFLPRPERGMLITERGGKLLLKTDDELRLIASIDDVYAQGEGGLMGLEVDRDFDQNRFIYTCYASRHKDVRLVRWHLAADSRSISSPQVVVADIPLNPSGRHSGCRVKMDAGGILWIGTGDAAIGTHPQDPASLGGKILRVTRDGEAAPGNLGVPFNARIFSYGHRNVQGVALYEPGIDNRAGGGYGFSTEHGPQIDDEVNQLRPGNFGWNPVPLYNEQVPMTDLMAFPDAVEPVWSSGSPTLAPSGAALLRGTKWGVFENALAVTFLKAQQLRLQVFNPDGKLVRDDVFFEKEFGRLRAATLGIDGNLYVTTDNGSSKDKIIKITPN